MSTTALDFVRKLHSDAAFAQSISDAIGTDADFAKLVQAAAEAGFRFDQADYHAAERSLEVAQAQAFFKRVQSEDGLSNDLKAALAKASPEAAMEALVAFARGTGFHFTVATYLEAASQHHSGKGPSGELSDQDLDQVAGGYQPGPDGKTCIYDPKETLTHYAGGNCPDGHVGPRFTASGSIGCAIFNLPGAVN